MTYATWKLYWQPDERYGLGPEYVVNETGGLASGLLFIEDAPYGRILGTIEGLNDLSSLSDWEVTPVSNEEALALAQISCPDATMDQEGTLVLPKWEPQE